MAGRETSNVPIIPVELQAAMASDDLPDDTLSMVWMGMRVLLSQNTTMSEDIADLKTRTNELEEYRDADDENIAELKVTLKLVDAKQARSDMIQQSLLEEIDDLRSRSMRDNIYFSFDPEDDENIAELKVTLKLVDAKQARSDMIQQSLLEEIDDLRSRSMRDNIYFSFDPEDVTYKRTKVEDCESLVAKFLKELLRTCISNPVYVQSAHRTSDGRIIAKIPQTTHRSTIFRNVHIQTTKHYLNQQMTPRRSERRQFVLPKYKKNIRRIQRPKLFCLRTSSLSKTN